MCCTSTTSGARHRDMHRDDIDGVSRGAPSPEETYDHQLAAVLAALASGEPLPTEGRDAVGNMRVIDAVYAAAGVRDR